MPRPTPRQPRLSTENLFEDEAGQNPYAESGAESPAESNPFSPPSSSERPYRPEDFETQYPHHAGQIVALGAIGLVIALIGASLAAINAARSETITWGLFVTIPAQCISLAVSVPACLMGYRDRRAMEARAMDPTGLDRTRFGLRLGQAAVIVSVIPVVLLFMTLVWSVFF